MSDPNIQFYTLAELEEFAEIFIGKFHNPPDSLPVEIDSETYTNRYRFTVAEEK